MADKYGVSPDVRENVKRLALELGYFSKKPAVASAFSKRALLFLDRQTLFNDVNPFYAQIIDAMEQKLAEYGIETDIIVVKFDKPEDVDYYTFQNKNPAGVVFLSKIDDKLITAFGKTGLPLVLVDNWYYEGQEYDMVRANNYCSGYEAADYLVSKGHRSIAFVGRIDYSVSFRERYRGFADCLKIYGIDILHSDMQDIVYNKKMQWGFISLNDIYDSEKLKNILLSPECPTALFCANDTIAVMVLKQLNSMNISVPDKISVVGCDNTVESDSFELTTVDVFPKSMGHCAAELLMDRINSRNRPSRYIQVSSKLIERKTVIEAKINSALDKTLAELNG